MRGKIDASISGIQFAIDVVEKTDMFKSLGGRLSSYPLLGCKILNGQESSKAMGAIVTK